MQWFIHDGQSARGPFPEAGVVAMIQARQLTEQVHVARDGSSQWMPISSQPVFQQAFQQLQAPSPAAPPIGQAYAPSHGPQPGYPSAGYPASPAPGYPTPGYAPQAHGYGQQGYAPGYPAPPYGAQPGGHRAAPKNMGLAVGAAVAGVIALSLVIWLFVRDRSSIKADVVSAKLDTSNDAKLIVEIKTDVKKSKERERTWVASLESTIKADPDPARPDEQGVIRVTYDVTTFAPGKNQLNLAVRYKSREVEKTITIEFERPPRLDVAANGNLTCVGRECGGTLSKAGTLEVKVADGATVTLDGVEAKSVGGRASVALDVVKHAVKLPLADAIGSGGVVKAPVSIQFADNVTVKNTLVTPAGMVGDLIIGKLKTVNGGGVSFGAGDDAPAAGRAVLIVGEKEKDTKLLGAGKSIREIDLVSIMEKTLPGTSCGTYRNTRTGEVISIERVQVTQDYRVYDRRTGRLKSRRVFRADPPECPDTLKAGEKYVFAWPSDDEIDAWHRSLLSQ